MYGSSNFSSRAPNSRGLEFGKMVRRLLIMTKNSEFGSLSWAKHGLGTNRFQQVVWPRKFYIEISEMTLLHHFEYSRSAFV